MLADFSHLSGRGSGPFVRLASALLPGVRRVQRQVEPYDRWWTERNLRELQRVHDGAPLWVALGDSMTLGVGASRPELGWVGQLAARHPRWACINLAIYGGRTDDVRERALPVLAALPPAAVVTLLIGNNDVLRKALRQTAAERLRRLLAEVPDGTVVGNQPGTWGGALLLNETIDAALAEQPGRLLLAQLRDPRTRSWNRSSIAPDFFHPNEIGYRGIADVFDDAVPFGDDVPFDDEVPSDAPAPR